MYTLYHHAFCPHSRFVRLVLGEYGLDLTLVDERPWDRREDFLKLNPAGTTPVVFTIDDSSSCAARVTGRVTAKDDPGHGR